MNRSKIEWTDYTLNPIKGLCPVDCKDTQGKSYCYARRMYRRLKWNPEIRFDVHPLLDVEKIKDPSRIFVGSTMELFGDWVDAFWLDSILATVRDYRQHTFIFLTKQPQNLARHNPWPDNAWVGATATNHPMYDKGMTCLTRVKARIRFISCEPLLEPISAYLLDGNVEWLILGAQTAPLRLPHREWVDDIEQRANKWDIPVFEKNNLAGLFPERKLRQELPA